MSFEKHLKCNKCGAWKPESEFSRRHDTPSGRNYKCKACYSEFYRTSDYKLIGRRRREKYPERDRARGKLNYAVKIGKVTKPTKCAWCGKTDCRISGHHWDYSLPLDAVWLCSRCHGHADRSRVSAIKGLRKSASPFPEAA